MKFTKWIESESTLCLYSINEFICLWLFDDIIFEIFELVSK